MSRVLITVRLVRLTTSLVPATSVTWPAFSLPESWKCPLEQGPFLLLPQLLPRHRTVTSACAAWFGRVHMDEAECTYPRRPPFGLLWHNG